ncbi:MATE family efflux transporter [Chromobacterium subtsugae]|uniref:Multidrug-efflux transporter n=1 Tax=Chromobacterium subtsugae TaxID=251747 RepID=A0ABS7FEM6_9NEIS|nr:MULTISPECIES: MATE family efflux transporter [Chromobacterium]KUM04095.1 MATE family efflux transporter [Chromobacterium subtsugae]KZE88070.1 MATE family efflux transporter [Chromobacterium sp. F49]MBW7565765.1 MATE family efflux transporter [Chromobacterium subtsugae]MBW8288530.1 MATE family efflux transporter [Chromobacterium subtsugae]WSE89859.1 MATE family efflux transporter [Chromobacterium subtsugae]
MKDLTEGAITRHILTMAAPIAIGMIFQALYFLIDLYFIGELGANALAGVGAAGNAAFLVLALTQVLGVGTVALISQAVGRKDRAEANLVFNQSLMLALLVGLTVLLLGYAAAHAYMASVSSDPATIAAGRTYLHWYMPGLALQFALVSMGSALRGTGIVQPTLVVQLLSVIINAILAPVLIAGWLTGHPLGVAGAGLASTLSLVAAVAALWFYFHRLEHYVGVDRRLLAPRWREWGRILAIGLPAGGEYALMFLFSVVIYWAIRDFGAAAQAAFGAGSRLVQGLILPAMAVAFAAGPIIGQNFGAGRADRVRSCFGSALLLISALMAALAGWVYWQAESLIGYFAKDGEVVRYGVQFLQLISWNFIAQGVIFTCSSVFQGLGDTRPALLSSTVRLLAFVAPVMWLTAQGGFAIEQVWYFSIGSTFIQALVSLLLLRQQFSQRLRPAAVFAR